MNKCYIRRKGTNRWLRFKDWERLEKIGFCDFSYAFDIESTVSEYHMENSMKESDVYEVSKDKHEVFEVEVNTFYEPMCYGKVR